MEKLFGQHWRTTVLGILGLLGVVVTVGTALLKDTAVDWTQVFQQVILSFGLVKAADATAVAK